MIAQEHAFSLGATRKKLTTYCQIVQVYFLNTSFLIRWLYRDIGNILPRIALCYMLHKISPVWTHRIARFIHAWSPSRHIYHWGNFNDAWYTVLDIYVDSLSPTQAYASYWNSRASVNNHCPKPRAAVWWISITSSKNLPGSKENLTVAINAINLQRTQQQHKKGGQKEACYWSTHRIWARFRTRWSRCWRGWRGRWSISWWAWRSGWDGWLILAYRWQSCLIHERLEFWIGREVDCRTDTLARDVDWITAQWCLGQLLRPTVATHVVLNHISRKTNIK